MIRLSSNRRFAGAGLTDDVQVSAPRVGIKHHERHWIGIITCRIIQEPDDWRGEMPNPIVPWSKKPISKLSGSGSYTFGRHAPPQPSLRSPSAM